MPYQLLDQDVYWCKATGQALGETNNKNTQLVVSFIVLGKVDPTNPDQYIPIKGMYERRWYRVLNENTIDFATMELKEGFGFAGDSFGQLDPKHPRYWSFKDQNVKMYCKHSLNQKNEMREEWSVARSGGPLIKEEASDDKIRQLDTLFAKNLEYLKGKGATSPDIGKKKSASAPSAGTISQEIDDSDIPF